jgi:predicted metal-dependent peptidase
MPDNHDPANDDAVATTAIDKIAAARVWLLKEKPFFGVLARAFAVEPRRDERSFRLYPDDRLAVNAALVQRMPFLNLAARLAHLALHAALGGFARRRGRDAARWNVAHDAAIDPLLRGAGLSAGLPAVADSWPQGASAEEVFALLPEASRPSDDDCDLCDPTPPPSASAGSAESAAPSAETPSLEAPASSSVDEQARALRWKMRLATAMQEERASGGKTWGDMPGWIDDMISVAIEPPPHWTVLLQRSVAALTRTDRTWLRPSRRMSALAGADGAWPEIVTMPGRRVVQSGQLVAVVDTSGSVDDATLGRFIGAVAAAAAVEGIEQLRLMQADSEIVSDQVISPAELLTEKVAIRGRGGTSFIPALTRLIEEARGQVERFSVVYLTDLEGMLPRSRDARSLDVLWVVPRKPRRKPPFGTVVEMSSP